METYKRVLLDHCVPKPLIREFGGYPATHVSELGWQDLDDRPLLERAAASFDVLITVDQNIPYQQNLSRLAIALVILKARKNTVSYLLPLILRLAGCAGCD